MLENGAVNKYWMNMIDIAIMVLNLNFVYVGVYYFNNSTRDREDIVLMRKHIIQNKQKSANV